MNPQIKESKYRINLLKLARYLYMLHLMKPKDKHLDMVYWNTSKECQTVCCAMGYTPLIFKKELKAFTKNLGIPQRYTNAEAEFYEGFMYYLFGVHFNSVIGKYMFASPWAYSDNTPRGAAIRITEVLYRKSGDMNVITGWKGMNLTDIPEYNAYKRRQHRYEAKYLKDGAINDWISYEEEQAKQGGLFS